MNKEIYKDDLPYGAKLWRYPKDNNRDSVGTVGLWAKPVREIYYQVPDKELFEGYKAQVMHIDRPEAENLRTRTAAGLTYWWERRTEFSIRPDRPPEKRVLTFAHEFGHHHQHECRIKFIKDKPWDFSNNPDEITRAIHEYFYQFFSFLQGHNISEKWAEGFRAACGDQSTIGTYSDETRAHLKPELVTMFKTAYWLSKELKSKKVQSLSFYGHGVMFKSGNWFWLDSIKRDLYVWTEKNGVWDWRTQ